MSRVLLATLLLALSLGAAARECGEGKVTGGMAKGGDALENFHCGLIARIYCRMAEDRAAGVEQDDAVRGAERWLLQYNSTGTHARYNWQPVLGRAAADVYATRPRQSGPIYYRAAYACGVAQRIGEPAALAEANAAFDRAADACEKKHYLRGDDGYPNQSLRACLAAAVDRVAPRPLLHRPPR